MASKETIEIVEESLDPVLEVGSVVARWARRDYIKAGIIASVAFAGGAAASYFVLRKRLAAQYNDELESQVKLAKEYYSKLNKSDRWSTPASAAEAMNSKVSVPSHEEIVEMYQGSEDEGKPEPEVVSDNAPARVNNVFTSRRGWDQAAEESKREARPDEPYVISEEEYLENELDFEQSSLTYYAGDNVLTDEKDAPIDMIDMVVGSGNLERFGHGNHSNGNIVFIRNPGTKMEFEVALHEGKYAHEVLGFIQHEDRRPRVRKFRGDDE